MSPYLLTLIILLSALLFLAAALLIGAFVAYRMAFYNNPRKSAADPYRHIKDDGGPESILSRKLIDNILSLPYENIYVTSSDGLRLRARVYITDKDAPFAIQMHGYKSTPMLDFSGGGAFAMRLGFNVIMPDQRASGESEGRSITFGVKESRDVLTWVDYVRKNYGEERKIMLFGVSLGAGTVIMTGGSAALPSSVVGIVADCPFSSAKAIITKVIYDMGLPGRLLYPLARLGGKIYGGFDTEDASATAAMARSSIPTLIIHGEADGFVPPDMSREIAAASPLAELHTFPLAKHGTSYLVDTERYERVAEEFCSRCLGINLSIKMTTDIYK